MDESILLTIKKMLGLAADYTAFDTDIRVFINGAFMVLAQLGLGDRDGFCITGPNETWADFMDAPPSLLEALTNFIYLSVKVTFDPPANSYVMTAYQNQIEEYKWRLNIEAERRERDEANKSV